MSEFSIFMSRDGPFNSLLFPGGGFLYTMIVMGEGFCPLRVMPQGFILRGDGFGQN